eukprot:2894010-Pyramimonas_sp.AAC.1
MSFASALPTMHRLSAWKGEALLVKKMRSQACKKLKVVSYATDMWASAFAHLAGSQPAPGAPL